MDWLTVLAQAADSAQGSGWTGIIGGTAGGAVVAFSIAWFLLTKDIPRREKQANDTMIAIIARYDATLDKKDKQHEQIINSMLKRFDEDRREHRVDIDKFWGHYRETIGELVKHDIRQTAILEQLATISIKELRAVERHGEALADSGILQRGKSKS